MVYFHVIIYNGQKLVNGTYKFKVTFDTNESEANTKAVNVNLTVKNNPPVMSQVKVINFGSLLVGESKTINIEVFNEGYGHFGNSSGYLYSSNISISSEHYKVSSNDVYSGFPPRATTIVPITFTPQSAGSHTATVTFTNKSNIEFKITVQGVATDPAKIVIDPEVVELGDLDVDAEATTAQFVIKNEGNYPLEYVFPKFSDQQLEASTGKTSHKYGYTALTNLNGATDFAYDGNPELIGATDITSVFSDDVTVSNAISLGFDFPFYGKTYDKIYINSLGGLAFSVGEYSYQPPLSESSVSIDGVGYITAYGNQLQFGPNSSVSYAKQDGKFVVNYSNVLAVKYDVEVTPISFRIMLSANGDVEVFYDSYDIDNLFQYGSTLFCAIKDPEGADPLVVTSADIADYWDVSDDPAGDVYTYFTHKSSVKFEAPAAYFVTNIEPAYAIVNPGESTTVTATIKADDTMYAGETVNRLTIETNDPEAATTFVNFKANITGANLLAAAALENSDIDFGKVFRTSDAKLPVTVKNTGKDVLTVNSISIVNNKFTTDITTPFTIEAGMSKDIIVTLPTENEGEVSDVMIIVPSIGDKLIASLKGEVIGCPGIELSFTEITETVESGAELAKELTITNNGDEPLVYSAVAGTMTELTGIDTTEGTVSYIYSSATDNENTKFEWIDIETTGLGEQYNFSYYNSHDYTTVELPFEFPFYGKTYNKMYIYNTGFVSFTERDDQAVWPEPPAEFPSGTIYTNIIAPYWGLHTMDTSKTAGTYHYMTENEVIVSWMEYGNTMNMGVCYQLIMKKDGSFKFQYKSYGDYAIIYNAFGLAGMANEDGSESLVIPDRLIQFNNAVQFTPVVETTLAPNASKSFGISVDTDKMAGTYSDVVTISTNVPHSETVEIPVNVTITGEPVAVYPTETIVEEHVAGYYSYEDPMCQMGVGAYGLYMTIGNIGKASFTVTNMYIEDETYMFQYLLYYGDAYDYFGNLTKNWAVYWNGMSGPIEVTTEGLKLAIPVDWGVAGTIGEYEGKVVVEVEGLKDVTKIEIPFKVIVTDIPTATLDKSEIRVENAAPEYVGTETVTLSNQGAYKLTYELVLDPTGEGESTDDLGGGGIMMSHNVNLDDEAAVAALKANLKSEITTLDVASSDDELNVYDAPSDFEYNRALFHPTLAGTSAQSYGAGNQYAQYKAATYYVAPEDGFNISHIYIATTLTNISDGSTVSNVDYTVEIVDGDDYENGTVLGKGSVHIDEMEGAKFMVVPLDKAVYMNGGQDFYVRITYPIGIEYPAYLSYKEESVVSNRFMGYVDGYGWFDMASMFKDTYGSLGYIMSCIETVPGEPWVKLLNETTSGEIAVSESIDLNVQLSAASAPLEKGNKAMLVIKSNDPNQSVINFPIYLDKNGAPTITVPTGTTLAAEGSVTEVTVNIADADGDDFTFSMTDNGEMSSIKTVDGGEAVITENEDGSYTVSGADATDGVNVTVEIAPEYCSEGNYTLTFDATDNIGNKASASAQYTVAHTNRAPVINELGTIQVVVGSTSSVIDFNDVFTDPDGDDMTFNLFVSSKQIVSTFVSGSSVIFVGNEVGTVTVQAVATDANGASTTYTFTVEVVEASGIEDITIAAEISVYPNPVVERLNVACDFDAAAANFAIYSLNGAKVLDETDDVARGAVKTINVGNLADGIYLLKVTANGSVATFHIVKN